MSKSAGRVVRLGTRQSPLALAQAESVAQQLSQQDPTLTVTIVGIQTKGDQDKTSALQEIGGKGVFIKTLEHALLTGEIDIAVHSAKDITSAMHPNLTISAVLSPVARHDSMIFTNGADSIESLPQNAIIATGSLRRQALVKRLYPTFTCIPIRGNVQTRLDIAQEKGYDAVLLSEVGLHRLKLDPVRFQCDPKVFIPAPSQGVIAIQQRQDDRSMHAILSALSDPETMQIFKIERHVMQGIGFDCHIPFGFYISPGQESLTAQSFIATPNLSDAQLFTTTCPKGQWRDAIDKMVIELKEWRHAHA